MTGVAHAFNIDLRRGDVACALPHPGVGRARGDAFRQFGDFRCRRASAKTGMLKP
jgi:hypothetical protein